MTLYTFHQKPVGAAPVALAHRFGGAAFVFGPFWLATKRMWVRAAVLAVYDLVILVLLGRGMIGVSAALAALLIAAAFVGLEAREWQRRALVGRGFVDCGLIFGASETEALMHWARAHVAPTPETRP